MVEVLLEDGDRIEVALKAFKRKMARSGILRDLRRKRYYVKPSEARQLKARGGNLNAITSVLPPE